jgi:hypothetical protein
LIGLDASIGKKILASSHVKAKGINNGERLNQVHIFLDYPRIQTSFYENLFYNKISLFLTATST